MQTTDHKSVVLKFFKLVSEGKFKEGLQFFSANCVTHNPYIAGNMDKLTDGMVEANKQGMTQYPNATFSVKHAVAEGDFVAVHTELYNNRDKPEEGGLRQIHLFRFDGGKIVEYWDVTQQITTNMPNAAGAF